MLFFCGVYFIYFYFLNFLSDFIELALFFYYVDAFFYGPFRADFTLVSINSIESVGIDIAFIACICFSCFRRVLVTLTLKKRSRNSLTNKSLLITLVFPYYPLL